MYFVVIAAIILGVVVLDQLTKLLTVCFIKDQITVPLWEDVFHFTYVENRGAAFGMLSDKRWVFMVISVVAIVAVLFYLIKYRPQNKWLVVSLSMIVGGGIGNMIDRIYLGYVIDFLDFRLIDFAVFNVADSFVTVGAGILIVYLVMDIINDAKKSKAVKAEKEQACCSLGEQTNSEQCESDTNGNAEQDHE